MLNNRIMVAFLGLQQNSRKKRKLLDIKKKTKQNKQTTSLSPEKVGQAFYIHDNILQK